MHEEIAAAAKILAETIAKVQVLAARLDTEVRTTELMDQLCRDVFRRCDEMQERLAFATEYIDLLLAEWARVQQQKGGQQ
jgi:transcriptional regulator